MQMLLYNKKTIKPLGAIIIVRLIIFISFTKDTPTVA